MLISAIAGLVIWCSAMMLWNACRNVDAIHKSFWKDVIAIHCIALLVAPLIAFAWSKIVVASNAIFDDAETQLFLRMAILLVPVAVFLGAIIIMSKRLRASRS